MRQQKYTNPAFKQYEIQSKNVNDIVFSSEQLIRRDYQHMIISPDSRLIPLNRYQ